MRDLDIAAFNKDDDDEMDEGLTVGTGPKCKRCGATDVRWRQQGGRWVLFSLTPGVEHMCLPVSGDDFDVL